MDDLVKRLSRDLAAAAQSLTADEARYLVDYYYICQEDRKRANNQERELEDNQEPHAIISWLGEQSSTIEQQIKRALDIYTDNNPLGVWAKENHGIGPVIAAGLLAHIDITKAPTVGHIWRFAGLDPTVKWEKGQKRPWNQKLKTLCWKIGQSFMKFSANEKCFYGQLYKQRKVLEIAKNEAGDFKEQAAEKITRFKKTTEAYGHYLQGHLPPAEIDARARRWAVKIFLSHYHEAGYILLLNKKPPLPFAVAILNHAHLIEPRVSPSR